MLWFNYIIYVKVSVSHVYNFGASIEAVLHEFLDGRVHRGDDLARGEEAAGGLGQKIEGEVRI